MVNNIPENFPDGVLKENVNWDPALGEAKYTIDPEYRTKSSDGFLYFATKLLPCVNARRTNFRVKRRKEVLSKIFTVSDEAYGLALLINEYESYQYKLRKENDSGRRPIKPFTSSTSGIKTGWNENGRRTYLNLYETVKTLREDQKSKDIENTMLEGFQDQDTGRKRQRRKINEIIINRVTMRSSVDQNSEIYKSLYTNV